MAASKEHHKDLRYEMVAEKEHREMTRIFAWAIVLELVLLAFVAFMILSIRIFSPTGEFVLVLKEYFPRIVSAAVFIILIKLVLDLIRVSIIRTVRRYKGMESTGLMFWRFASYTVWLVVFILIMLSFIGGAWEYMVWVGVIIAAIIYALAGALQNIAAWFVIASSHPFKIGDIVEMGERRGYVVDITMNNTVLREMGNWVKGDLFTGRVLSIPNKTIFETGVSNYTRYNQFIYDYLTVSITYESDLPRAEAVLLDVARDVVDMGDEVLKAVHDAETLSVIRQMPREPRVFWQFRDSAIELGVFYPVSMRKRFLTRSEITKRFMSRIKDEPNISVAYPHIELVKHELSKDRKEVA